MNWEEFYCSSIKNSKPFLKILLYFYIFFSKVSRITSFVIYSSSR